MAMPAYKNTGTAVTSAGDVTVSWPTHVEGDVAFLCLIGTTITAPSGWANAAAKTVGSSVFRVYYKRASSDSEGSVAVTTTGNSIGVIFTVEKEAATIPWQIDSKLEAAGSIDAGFFDVYLNGSSVGDGSTVIGIYGVNGAAAFSSITNGDLASITERVDSANGTVALGVFSGIDTTAGSVGPTNIAASAGTATGRLAFCVEIQSPNFLLFL